MNALDFPEVNVRIAEKQEEYETLPAYYNNQDGSITYAIKLDAEELKKVQETGVLWFKQLTNGKAMQPINISFVKEAFIPE